MTLLGNFLSLYAIINSMDAMTEIGNSKTQKPWTDEELLFRLRTEGMWLPPAQIRLSNGSKTMWSCSERDDIVEVIWHGRRQQYSFEYKAKSNPQAVEQAMLQAQCYAAESGLPPLVIVPFMSEKLLRTIEQRGMSGIDLSGNGVILAPDFTIWRSGQPNRYQETRRIQNIYRGSSSLFVRCFLLRGEYLSLNELREYALERLDLNNTPVSNAAKLTKSTASKVVAELEQEMIIRKDGRRLVINDAGLLLSELSANYRPTLDTPRLTGKTLISASQVWQRLEEMRQNGRLRYGATGLGSAAKYGTLSGPDKLSLYVSNLEAVAELIELQPTRVFPNIELIEEKDDLVYFDARRRDREVWASPVQTWIELAAAGPREREAAQVLRAALVMSQGEHL